MTDRIDAHHHLWKYSATEYGWIGEDMRCLRRDYLPLDLQAEMESAGVQSSVAVQARQTLEETRWLLRLAEEYPFIAGVVGWASIASPDFPAHLEALRASPKLKGLRHVLQDEPDDAFMLREDFQRGITAMRDIGLVYDILIHERHLPYAAQLADRNPNQIFVLDHLAKPKIRAGELSPWRGHLHQLAQRPNVYCKLSGMVTEADWNHWTVKDLRPYVEAALESFGPQRLLAGSDWPVCTVAASYERWWKTLGKLISALSSSEQESILGGNAIEVYRLEGNKS